MDVYNSNSNVNVASTVEIRDLCFLPKGAVVMNCHLQIHIGAVLSKLKVASGLGFSLKLN